MQSAYRWTVASSSRERRARGARRRVPSAGTGALHAGKVRADRRVPCAALQCEQALGRRDGVARPAARRVNGSPDRLPAPKQPPTHRRETNRRVRRPRPDHPPLVSSLGFRSPDSPAGSPYHFGPGTHSAKRSIGLAEDQRHHWTARFGIVVALLSAGGIGTWIARSSGGSAFGPIVAHGVPRPRPAVSGTRWSSPLARSRRVGRRSVGAGAAPDHSHPVPPVASGPWPIRRSCRPTSSRRRPWSATTSGWSRSARSTTRPTTRHGPRASPTSARPPASPTATGRRPRACRSTGTSTTSAATPPTSRPALDSRSPFSSRSRAT